MEVIRDKKVLKELCKNGTVVTAGNFDGVHIGHKAIISDTVKRANELGLKSVVITFDTHPVKIIGKDTTPYLITSAPHKIRLIAETGANYCYLIDFTKEFASMCARDFIKDILVDTLKTRHMIVGYDFYFGKNRSGDYALLCEFGKDNAFTVDKVEKIDIEGLSLSSTDIRSAIKRADFAEASKLLGRSYSLFGEVVTGAKVGRTIGFPTANIDPLHELVPKTGVYAVKVKTKDTNTLYNGVLNIGFPPYFVDESKKDTIKIEVFILDFKADIYGQEIEVFFIKRIRDEMSFSGTEALSKQISFDLETAKEIFDLNN